MADTAVAVHEPGLPASESKGKKESQEQKRARLRAELEALDHEQYGERGAPHERHWIALQTWVDTRFNPCIYFYAAAPGEDPIVYGPDQPGRELPDGWEPPEVSPTVTNVDARTGAESEIPSGYRPKVQEVILPKMERAPEYGAPIPIGQLQQAQPDDIMADARPQDGAERTSPLPAARSSARRGSVAKKGAVGTE